MHSKLSDKHMHKLVIQLFLARYFLIDVVHFIRYFGTLKKGIYFYDAQ